MRKIYIPHSNYNLIDNVLRTFNCDINFQITKILSMSPNNKTILSKKKTKNIKLLRKPKAKK